MEIAIVALIQGVAVAVIGGFFAKDSKKRKAESEKTDKRALIRAKESALSMKLMSANTALGIEIARAVKNGTTNGEMERALEKAADAQREYFKFINEIAAKQFTD